MKNDFLQQYQQQTLRCVQLKQLDILIAIDQVCSRHNIPYWLDAGTLLGAVRHGGFIPWDDDIDIAMRSEDLERFVAIAPAELPKELFVSTPEQEPTKEPLVKVRDLNSFFVEPGDDFTQPYEKGVFVDIFPFVTYPNVSPSFIRRVTRQIARSGAILRKPHHYGMRAVAELLWFGMKLFFLKALWSFVSIFCPNSRSKYVGYRVINNGCGNSHHRDHVWPLSTITFEGHTFPAPHNVDAYLSDLFHDYMQVPPPDKREIHAVFFMPELIATQRA